MKNEHGLPPEILAALAAAEARYDRGESDYTVTELIDSPQAVQLRRRHREAVEEATDASQRIYSLWGRAIHQVMEDASLAQMQRWDDPDFVVVEERIYLDAGKYVVGGQVDNLRLIAPPGGIGYQTLQDWKGVGVYTTKGGIKGEWESQLNLYALLVEHGRSSSGKRYEWSVGRLQNIALYRDWSRSEWVRSQSGRRDYPPPAEVFDVPLWSKEKRWEYLFERLALHAAAAELPDHKLPACTPAERWQKAAFWAVVEEPGANAVAVRGTEAEAAEVAAGMSQPDKWAVVKPGAARALRLYEDLTEAYAHAERVDGARVEDRPGKKYQVEHRPARPIRCADGWCPAARANVCRQWREETP
jgi:hypothetical protein